MDIEKEKKCYSADHIKKNNLCCYVARIGVGAYSGLWWGNLTERTTWMS